MRQRMDGELEQLRSNMHRILSEQQQEFAQAFGLCDEHSSSEVHHCKKNQHWDGINPSLYRPNYARRNLKTQL